MFCSLSQLYSLCKTDTFFFITNSTNELFARDMVILLQFPTKSFMVDVTEVALMGLLSKPTPTRGYFSILPSFFKVIPTTPSSIRSWVCRRKFSVMPVNRITTLNPASAALQIKPVYVAVFPDCTSPMIRPRRRRGFPMTSLGFPRQFIMSGNVTSSSRLILIRLMEE